MNEETTIKYLCKDEAYCEWYECLKCGNTMITEESNYCPNCGRKIIKNNEATV